MKRFHALTTAALALGLTACEKKDAPTEPPATKTEKAATPAAGKAAEGTKAPIAKPAAPAPVALEMAPIELTADDFAATMDAPTGATFADSFGTLEVKLGDGKDFFIQIDPEAPDMAKVKASVNENDVQKLQKFHTDTDTVLIYETLAFGKTSFWLDAAIKVGDKTVHCYSGRGAPSFTQPQVEGFLEACKTLKPK